MWNAKHKNYLKLKSIAKRKGYINLSTFWEAVNDIDNKTLKKYWGNGGLSSFHTYLLDNSDRNFLGEEENKLIRSIAWDIDNVI